MLNIDNINDAKHVVISLPKEATVSMIASANALYSYILTLHKKVSLYSEQTEFGKNLDFLPWMDKVKSSYPSSADLDIKLKQTDDVFAFFKKNEIKLNQKISTSLYASLVAKNDGFLKNIDGMVFAEAKELIEAGADVNLCNENILHYNSLACLRLKAVLLSKMLLVKQGEIAMFELTDNDLKSTGTKLEDATVVVKDALSLPTVKTVIVKYENKEILREGEEV